MSDFSLSIRIAAKFFFFKCSVTIATASGAFHLLLDTHPRAAAVIGWALFGCHWGNRMMGILTHERKCQRRISLAASVRLPFRHMWGVQKAEAPIGLFAYPSDEGGSTGFSFFLLFFFFWCLGTGAEWGPAGSAAAAGLHPRVWRLESHWRAGEKRRHVRNGETETKRRKFFYWKSGHFNLGEFL